MAFGNDAWFAATTGGILVSKDQGVTWKNAGTESFLKQPATSLEANLDGTRSGPSRRTLWFTPRMAELTGTTRICLSPRPAICACITWTTTNLFITSNMGLYTPTITAKTGAAATFANCNSRT